MMQHTPWMLRDYVGLLQASARRLLHSGEFCHEDMASFGGGMCFREAACVEVFRGQRMRQENMAYWHLLERCLL